MKLKVNLKPTVGIRNSMKRRDKYYKKFIKADIKSEYEKLYKDSRK